MACATKLLKELATKIEHLEKMVVTTSTINSGLIALLEDKGMLESAELSGHVKDAMREYMLLCTPTPNTLH